MGERRVDSCTEVNRRSLCVLATTTKICDQLSVSVSGKGIIERFGWVQRKDALLWKRRTVGW